MQTFTVLIAENDAVVAHSLSESLHVYFRSVRTVCSLDELKSAISRLHADAVIADLETVPLSEVVSLCREFQLPVVCTHRVPDEQLWTAALEAGAADVCDKCDVAAILRAITSNRQSSAA